jgi:hypothetical protein
MFVFLCACPMPIFPHLILQIVAIRELFVISFLYPGHQIVAVGWCFPIVGVFPHTSSHLVSFLLSVLGL